MSKLFGKSFITLKYLKRYPNSKRTGEWRQKIVHIHTDKGYWRVDGRGYCFKPDAWVIDFDEAWGNIAKLGPEKYATLVDANSKDEVRL